MSQLGLLKSLVQLTIYSVDSILNFSFRTVVKMSSGTPAVVAKKGKVVMRLPLYLPSCFLPWLLVGSAFAEPPASVSVVAEGMAPFLKEMSLEEAQGRARDEARRNAIEQAVGVFVRGTTVLHNSQIADELIASVARGVIEQEQWIDEGIRDIQDDKHRGQKIHVYHSKVKALVRPVRVERRAGFEIQASLNKQVFQEGEEALIKVRSSQPAYLYLFSVTQDGSVTMLMPNQFMKRHYFPANQDVLFPGEALRTLGVRLRVTLPPRTRKAVEYIKVIAIRKPVRLVKESDEQAQESAFAIFSGAEGGMIHDLVKRLALLDDEDWTETTVPYEVRQ